MVAVSMTRQEAADLTRRPMAMLNPPHTFSDLLAYLGEHPRVRCRIPGRESETRTFTGHVAGGLTFHRDDGTKAHTPLVCGKTAHIVFEPTGFAVENFGVTIWFDYLPEDNH